MGNGEQVVGERGMRRRGEGIGRETRRGRREGARGEGWRMGGGERSG